MKITQVEIIPLDIPFRMPFRVSYGAVVPGNFVVVRVSTDEGVVGIGNSQGFTREPSWKRPRARTRDRKVSCTRSSATEGLPVSRVRKPWTGRE